MNVLITLVRILTAVAAPIFAVTLSILVIVTIRKNPGRDDQLVSQCLRCSQNKKGSEARFFFSTSIGGGQEFRRKQHPALNRSPILDSERHFICDQCADRYIYQEAVQQILLSLAYPVYLFVIIPLFSGEGMLFNFLIETLLVLLAVAGAVSAYDLLRAVRKGSSPRSEARDRVAIYQRKKALGKKYDFYTRLGRSKIDSGEMNT